MFQFGGTWSFVWGAKPPRGDRTECREPWYRIWRGVVTAHTIVGVQHQRWTVVIALRRQRQSSEQEHSYLTASKRHPSTPYSYNTPKGVYEESGHIYTFPRSTKHVYRSLACSQHFLKFCWRVEICSVVLRPQRKPHWVSSSFGSIIFAASWHPLFLGDLA